MLFGDTPLADQVVLSPGERALLVEQAENAKVALTMFIGYCEKGEAGDAVRSWVDVTQAFEFARTVLTKKINRAIHS